MIRRGKSEGWLKLPYDAVTTWSTLQGASLSGVAVGTVPGHEHKGGALRATESSLYPSTNPLIVVPRDLVLSRETVEDYARSGDACLKEVLDAAGDFAKTSRGAILIFLLVHATHSCPDLLQPVGVRNPFTDYIKLLPLELLPTFWNQDERHLLKGTSLDPALQAKLSSLYREYETFQSATSGIAWCSKIWWDDVDGILSFDDWKHVDAMYRSRALEFPGIGHAMVPLIDMANHASGLATAALYESDEHGNALLLLRPDQKLDLGDEVTITWAGSRPGFRFAANQENRYGDEKGACEMIFSYGFIDQPCQDARDLFLELTIPDDDPLRLPKKHLSGAAPGVRISSRSGNIEWVSDFVYTICVNEEDGLEFKIAQTTDGERELQVFWKDKQLQNLSNLKLELQQDELWHLFQLRAAVTIQQRLTEQLEALQELPPITSSEVRDVPKFLAAELRRLETVLVQKSMAHFEQEIEMWSQSEVVQRYLQASMADEDDFS